jgi:hypothetical protein
MWHTAFIALHALAGLVSFLAGCVAIRRGSWFGIYLWSLLGMMLLLVVAVAVEWGDLDAASRVLFTALAALAGYMILRALQARGLQPVAPARPSARYLDHVGFTLVALVDAFVVVLVLDLGGPAWLIVLAGIAVAIAGHFVLRALKKGLAFATPALGD